jgi:catechol 2,3-dioxygenase-like lactoylglutathione lyase family enzyme
MSGLDHVAFAVADYDKSIAFYNAVLKPLGIEPLMAFDQGGKVTGFGHGGQPYLWVGDGGPVKGRLHYAFGADARAAVDAFYAAAMANGGTDNGPPGVRAHYHENYYAAYVLDPDGHNIEAVCHAAE